MSVLLYATSAWAVNVTVLPKNGVYWKNGAVSSDTWAPIWKSKATALDGTTPLLTFTGETGMNTANGNIYSRQTYTLTAPTGYVIVGYTFNGTATGDAITITPAGGSGTTVSSGDSLATPLSVDVNAQSTTFALASSGDAHFESLALTVKVEHIVSYSKSTGSYTVKNSDGTWASQWESTATDPRVTLSVGANNIAVSTGYIYSGSSTATYTLTAQNGYVITGYEIKGTAQEAAQTLTPFAGGSAVSFGTDKEYTLSVTGLSTGTTSFTQSTPNKGIAISSFKIFLEKECKVTYVISDANGVIYTSAPIAALVGETITALPSSLQRSYCTYSDINQTMVNGDNTINVTCTFAPPFTVSTSFADATWYYATIRGSKYLRADDNAKDGNGRYSTNSSNEWTDVYKWAFFGNPYALYIANKGQGNGKYLNAGSAVPNFVETNTPSTTTATLWEAITNGDGFTLRSLTGTNLYINDAGNDGNLGYWNSASGRADAGGKWVVTKEFDALIAQLEAIPFGTGVNQYRLVVESTDYTSQAAVIISGIKTQGFTADNLATAQLLLASATLNLPAAGFYRIKGQTSKKYLASGMASNNKFAMTDATDATTIFYYDGTKVVNFSSGMANGMSTSSWNWVTDDAASTVTFADGETNGGYSFKSSNAFFYDGGTNADRGSSLNTDARYRNWYLTEVTSLPVTISAAGYATFNSPVAVEIPQDQVITAYQASVQDADYIRLVSIDDGVIPANFPVVLKGNPGTYTFNITTTELTGENYHANELKGSIAAKRVSVGEIYTLQRDSETTVGFYPNAGETFKGFSAYLTSASGSRGFQMVSSTGIEHIATPILFENAYDLQGRKAGIVKKGVYIVNGKKVLF